MDLNVDPRQTANDRARSLEPSDLRTPHVVDGDRSIAGPGRPQDSFRAECECPDDCPRDHANE
jgi:hypothetical protein